MKNLDTPNTLEKGEHIYSGKSKSLFLCAEADAAIMHFRDDLTAFDGQKKAVCARKGIYNNLINAHLMEHLSQKNIAVHFIRKLNERESLVRRLHMLKIEFVVRNIAAGTLCKRLGLAKGSVLSQPVCEIFFKNDELGDPLINDSHIDMLKLASPAQVAAGKKISLAVNTHLTERFAQCNLILVDFKLEFGYIEGAPDTLLLGDDITPDSCRLWEKDSHRPFDKDLFRFDLGDIGESYKSLVARLGIAG